MRRTAAAIGTVAVVGLLAVGCGSSSSDADDSPMTEAQLSEVLLTASEVGTGWTPEPDDGSEGGGSKPSCLEGVEGGSAVAEAEATFVNGETAFAGESLGAQESEEAAKESYEKVTDALDGCTDVSITSNGRSIAGTITANGEVDFGDGAKSYTMDFSVDGVPLGFDIVVAHTGSVDVLVMYGTLGSAEPGAVDTMAEKAIEKVETGATSENA